MAIRIVQIKAVPSDRFRTVEVSRVALRRFPARSLDATSASVN
jgi:hypothetical protein